MFKIVITLAVLIFAVYKLTPMILKHFAIRAYNQGNIAKTLRLYKTASDLFGKHIQYKTEYGLILMRIGEFKEAENIFNEIILDTSVEKKNKINVYAYRAMAYHKQGRNNDALEDMEELYKTSKSSVVYGMLGFLKQLTGESAVSFCEEAYDYNSDDRDICDNMLVAYTREGRLDKATEIAENLREKYPDFVEAFYHSAQLELKKGNFKKAKDLINKTDNCRRSMLTTVSEEEVNLLKEEIKNA